jgi:curved DNA-binding protein CbpA
VDHYERLAVERDAPTDEIRAAFRAGMRRDHPDAGGSASGREIDHLVEAWRVLRNPTDRRHYDEHLRGRETPTAAPAYVEPTWSEDDEATPGGPARWTLVVLVASVALLMLAVLIGVVIGGFTQGPTGL